MEIVKKNLLSIICGVVALAAIVALFWPLGRMQKQTQEELKKREEVYRTMTSLRTMARQLPIVDPDATTQERLTSFPTDTIIKAGMAVKETIAKQALEMKHATVDRNRRDPLMPGVFPVPGDLRYRYQDAYLDAVRNKLPKVLNAIAPPNDEEIKSEAQKIYDKDFKPQIIKVGGKEVNADTISKQFTAVVEKLPERLRTERAKKYTMYIDAGAIALSHNMIEGQQPKEEQIWYAQNMLWIEEDICSALAAINANPKGTTPLNVTQAPVKQLLKIDIPEDFGQYINSDKAVDPTVGYVATPEELAGKVWNKSPLGRVCNPVYDVIHYTVILNVDSRFIPSIIAGIQRGKLITVWQADTGAVDSLAAVDQGYIYGDAPICTLTLQCESLFMRDWTTPLMPKDVKKNLLIDDPTAPKPQ